MTMWPDGEDGDRPEAEERPQRPGTLRAFALTSIAVAALLGTSYLYYVWAPNAAGVFLLVLVWSIAVGLVLFTVARRGDLGWVALIACLVGVAALLGGTQTLGRGLAYTTVAEVETCTVEAVDETPVYKYNRRTRYLAYRLYEVSWTCGGTMVSSQESSRHPHVEPGESMEVAHDPRGTMAPVPADEAWEPLWPSVWFLTGSLLLFAAHRGAVPRSTAHRGADPQRETDSGKDWPGGLVTRTGATGAGG